MKMEHSKRKTGKEVKILRNMKHSENGVNDVSNEIGLNMETLIKMKKNKIFNRKF